MKYLRKLIWQVAAFSGVRVITYAVMDNHFHVLAEVPPERVVSDGEIVRRFAVLYPEPTPWQPLTAGDLAELLAKNEVRGQELREEVPVRDRCRSERRESGDRSGGGRKGDRRGGRRTFAARSPPEPMSLPDRQPRHRVAEFHFRSAPATAIRSKTAHPAPSPGRRGLGGAERFPGLTEAIPTLLLFSDVGRL